MGSTTEIGGADKAFPRTSWTVVLAARGEGPETATSWNQLVALYWKPVYWFIRTQWRKPNDEAKDLTQEFFASLFERSALEAMKTETRRFRTFLRACLENFLRQSHRDRNRIKRGGAASIVPLDAGDGELEVAGGELTPEQAFDRAWSQTLLKDALVSLEAIYRSTGRTVYWLVFERYHLADVEPASYLACGQELGLSSDDVQNRLRHARKTLRELVRERVRDSLADPADLEDELRALAL